MLITFIQRKHMKYDQTLMIRCLFQYTWNKLKNKMLNNIDIKAMFMCSLLDH